MLPGGNIYYSVGLRDINNTRTSDWVRRGPVALDGAMIHTGIAAGTVMVPWQWRHGSV